MNTAQLAALLGSFIFGLIYAFYSAWPRRQPLEPAPEPSEPVLSWPAMLDLQTRIAIAMQIGARSDPERFEILRQARAEERDPRIIAVLEQALVPVIGEPQ
ncbi:MAG TPA: hypothetical protein VFA29_00830 [Candidatus Baltobacteraceae bacterium]|nr:hypothetical protein [Candidatus Baltobacteraceae bacterium]